MIPYETPNGDMGCPVGIQKATEKRACRDNAKSEREKTQKAEMV